MEKRDANGLTEKEFLEAYATKNYPRPYLTADIIVFSEAANPKRVLLIRRKNHPCIECWAFPGGFSQADESLEQTAARELEEETGIVGLCMRPLAPFSRPGRDPRGWIVTEAYVTEVAENQVRPVAGDDAGEAVWFDLFIQNGQVSLKRENTVIEFEYRWNSGRFYIHALSKEQLAFDHAEMLCTALHLYQDR